jgi:hypothetical protein
VEPRRVVRGGRAARPGQGHPARTGHPLLQVQGYCDYITDFISYVSARPDAVRGVAYLHNAADLDVEDLFQLATTERTRLFTKTRCGAFIEYLRAQFAPEGGVDAGDRLLDSAARPSKQLLKLAAAESDRRSTS